MRTLILRFASIVAIIVLLALGKAALGCASPDRETDGPPLDQARANLVGDDAGLPTSTAAANAIEALHRCEDMTSFGAGFDAGGDATADGASSAPTDAAIVDAGNELDAAERINPKAANLPVRFDRGAGDISPRFAGNPGPVDVTIPERASGAFTVRDAKTKVGMRVSLVGANSVAAETAAGEVVFRAASASGGDVVHRATPTGTEDLVVVPVKPAKTEIAYDVWLENVAGVRLVGGTFELLDSTGDPRVRMRAPEVRDANCVRVIPELRVDGCLASSDARPPWGRPVTSPESSSCRLVVSWDDSALAYPIVVDPTWSSTTAVQAMAGYPFVSVPDVSGTAFKFEDVITAGGAISGGGAQNVQVYRWATNTWAALSPLAVPRANHTFSITADSAGALKRAVIAGGTDNTGTFRSDTPIYDLVTATWSAGPTPIPDMRRQAHKAVTLTNGRVVVTGGEYPAGTYHTDINIFYPGATDAWRYDTNRLVTGRMSHAATVLTNGDVLVAGGWVNPNRISSLELFTPSTVGSATIGTNNAVAAGSLSGVREWIAAARMTDGKVLFAGGQGTVAGAPASVANVDVYAPNASPGVAGSISYLTTQPLPTALSAAALLPLQAANLNTNAVLVGGFIGAAGSTPSIAYRWNSATGWSLVTNALSSGHGFAASGSQANRRVVVAAGYSNGTSVVTAQADLIDFCDEFCEDGNPCTTDSCDATGACVRANKTGGTACSDGLFCNGAETCDAVGHCNAGTPPVVLNDGNLCTLDVCDEAGDRVNPPVTDSRACDDGNACTIATTCNMVGQCVGGSLAAAGTLCADDGNPCNGAEICNGTTNACGNQGAPLQPADDTCFTHVCVARVGWTSVPRTGAPAECTMTPPAGSTVDSTVLSDASSVASWLWTTGRQTGIDVPSPFTTNPAAVAIISGYVRFRMPTSTNYPDGMMAAPSGLRVAILGRPGFGWVPTSADGRFDIAVLGGADYTVKITDPASGYFELQRSTHVNWQDWILLDDLVLTPTNGATPLPVNLSSTSGGWQIARGPTLSQPGFPSRTPVLLFPPTSNVTAPDGYNGTNVEVLFNEYTTDGYGERSMPGALPPTSAYTYALEMRLKRTSNGEVASSVTFDSTKPSPIFYVENFVQMSPDPTAAVKSIDVPGGSYDRTTGAWRSDKSGRIVKIISHSGIPNAVNLDVNGDGISDSSDTTAYAALGITDAERVYLATLGYPEGAATAGLWRMPMAHFTAWDCNWGFGYPSDATFPEIEPKEVGSTENGDTKCGSIIECQNQILGEKIAIAGTPYELRYSSERHPGYRARIRVPLTRDAYPTSLAAASLSVTVGGRLIHKNKYFRWGGTNTSASFVQPAVNGTVSVQYGSAIATPLFIGDVVSISGGGIYSVVSSGTAFTLTLENLGYAGNAAPGAVVPSNAGIAASQLKPNLTEVVTWDRKDALGREMTGLVRAYVKVGYTYDGVTSGYRTTPEFGAGGGGSGTGSQVVSLNRAAMQATLYRTFVVPIHVASAKSAGLGGWQLDAQHQYNFHSQYVALGDGSRRLLNGKSDRTLSLVQAEANGQKFNSVAFGPDGTRYVAFYDNNNRIYMYPPGGGAGVAIAGTGGSTSNIGLLPTTDQDALTTIIQPTVMAIGPDGALYLSDFWRKSVDKLWKNGSVWKIRRIAGCATGCTTGAADGLDATTVTIDGSTPAVRGMVVASDGTVYFSDLNRVRALAPPTSAGGPYTMRTVAGDPTKSWAAIPATDNSLLAPRSRKISPIGLALAPDGTLYFGDDAQCTIWAITPAGYLRPFAGGTGCAPGSAPTGDGGSARVAQFSRTLVPTVLTDGSVLIRSNENAEGDVQRALRIVTQTGVVEALTTETTSCSSSLCSATAALRGNGLAPGVTLGPQGDVYVVENQLGASGRIWRLGPAPVPGCTSGTCIPSEDGKLVYVFDARGKHIKTKDAVQGLDLLTFNYTPDATFCPTAGAVSNDGCLTSIVDASGKTTRFQRVSATQIKISSPFGQITELNAIDANRYVTQIKNPANEIWTLGYDPVKQGLLTTMRKPAQQPSGAQFSFIYDADGRLTTDTNALGAPVTLSRQDFDQRGTTGTTTVGGSSTFFKDAMGRPEEYRIERRSNGDDLRTTIGADAIASTVEYRNDGTVFKQRRDKPSLASTDGLELTTKTTTHPRLGAMVTVPTERTVTSKSANYGDRSRVEQVCMTPFSGTNIFGITSESTKVTVNPGATTGCTGASTFETLFEDLGAGVRRVTSNAPLGRSTRVLIDSKNRPTTATAVNSTVLPSLQYTYVDTACATSSPLNATFGGQTNCGGRLTEVRVKSSIGTDPDRVITQQYQYGLAGGGGVDTGYLSGVVVTSGTQTSRTSYGTRDATEALTSNGRDAVGRIKKIAVPNRDNVDLVYDANGNNTQITLLGNASGRPIHGLPVNGIDLLNTYQPPNVIPALSAKDTSYTYNAARQPWTVTVPWTDGATRRIRLGYDGAGRVKESEDTASGQTATFTYDDLSGYLTGATTSDGTSITQVTAGGLLRENTSPVFTVSNSVLYGYEAGTLRGNNVRVQSGAYAAESAFVFDAAGALDRVDVVQGSTLVAHLGHTRNNAALGRVEEVTAYTEAAPSYNVKESFQFNGFSEPTKLTTTLNTATTIFQMASAAGGTFARDELGRLRTWRETNDLASSNDFDATYDVNGRLSTWKKGTAITTYAYDADGNRTGATTSTGGDTITAVTIDAQDRLTGQTLNGVATAYAYTDEGTLLRRTRATGSDEFTYDVGGALRKVVFKNSSGTVLKTVEYVIDAYGRRVGKKVGIGAGTPTPVEGYVYAGDRLVAKTNQFGTATQVYVYGTKLNVPEMIVEPAAGGIYRVVSDWRGSVRAIARVTSFTNVVQRIEYDGWGRATETGTSGFQPFGFAGGLYDVDTKLVRFGARDYDAEAGRWTSKDPSRFRGGWNLYAYCDNDPINFVDVTGEMKLPANPSGLGPEWTEDPRHRHPNGKRYAHPSGDTLDWHPARPGKGGHQEQDHWHHNRRHGKKGKPNFPGDEVADPPPVCSDPGASPTPYDPADDDEDNRNDFAPLPLWPFLPFFIPLLPAEAPWLVPVFGL